MVERCWLRQVSVRVPGRKAGRLGAGELVRTFASNLGHRIGTGRHYGFLKILSLGD